MKRIVVFLISLIIVLIPIASHASASENEIKRPRLLIESGSAEPASVAGNTDFELKIKLKNIGTAAAHYIRVTAAAEDEDIILTSDMNGTFLEKLPHGQIQDITFKFRMALHAKNGEHHIIVSAAYEDADGQEHTTDAAFRVFAEQPVEIVVDDFELPDSMESGSMASIPVFIYNPSDADAYNVTVSLAVDGIICGSVLFDRLASGEQAEKELHLVVMDAGSGKQYGETKGNLEIEYEDENGEKSNIVRPVSTNITPSERLSPDEEALQEEEYIKQNTLSKWWISVLVAVAVIAVLCSIIIVGKLSRIAKIK